MFNKLKEKIVVIAAPVGPQLDPEIMPYLPITPEEITEETYRCYQAGASVVHAHARDVETRGVSFEVSVLSDIFTRIRAKCPIIIQSTGAMGGGKDKTGKWVRPTEEQRLPLLDITPEPDAISTPMGTMDMVYPGGYATAFNTPPFLKKMIPGIIKKKWAWETEIWDVHFLHNTMRLANEGVFDKNMKMWFNYCLGDNNGSQPSNPRQLLYISDEGKRLFPNSVWQVTSRAQNYWQMAVTGVLLGCDIIRIGFEDFYRLPNGQRAKNTAEMVETAVKIITDLGLKVATVEEAKEILGVSK
jgi:3-keto-5-aminohexanoate cleavage enzyme